MTDGHAMTAKTVLTCSIMWVKNQNQLRQQHHTTLKKININSNKVDRLAMSMLKSGACPVIPNTVVLRYFSWPARSINVTTYIMHN